MRDSEMKWKLLRATPTSESYEVQAADMTAIAADLHYIDGDEGFATISVAGHVTDEEVKDIWHDLFVMFRRRGDYHQVTMRLLHHESEYILTRMLDIPVDYKV